MTEQKFISIQSSMNITVTPGLHASDVTNEDAHVPDRLKVQPLWPKASVDIFQGVRNYPAEIAEWPTVKALVKDKILTIGPVIDEGTITNEERELKSNLKTELEQIKSESNIKVLQKIQEKKKAKQVDLSELAGE